MTDYDLMCRELYELSDGIDYDITVLSNASALLFAQLDRLNWAGFYLFREGDLKLGPFQGKPACTVIRLGKGGCGTAAAEDRTVLVPDVHQFPGHIACDSASNSEIVIPIHKGGRVAAVLDIDSPVRGRFNEKNTAVLGELVRRMEEKISWEG